MGQQTTGRARVAGRLLIAAALAAAAMAHAAKVVQPPFADDFVLVDLGEVPGVHAPYGGVAFLPDDPDSILLVGYMGAGTAVIHTVPLARDVTDSIAGFAGQPVANVPSFAAADSIAWGPGDVLFYPRSTAAVAQMKPDSTTVDKVVDLSWMYYKTTGIGFVPPGLPDAGTMKLVTFNYGDWWRPTLTPDGNGTFDMTVTSKGPSLPGYPTGFAYVSPDTPGAMPVGLVLCERELGYGDGKVVRYDVDDHSDPIVTSRQVVVSGLDIPEGIAMDPVTGDVLFVGYQGRLYLLRQAAFPPTTTTVPTTTVTTSTSTSSSTSSSTSTSVAPTTTTSSTRPSTSTSSSSSTSTSSSSSSTLASTSTIVPTTTSTSSSTVRPTTTSTSSSSSSSTSSSSTSSSSTTTSAPASSSSTSTTTLPSAGCGTVPTFASIGCRVDALLALVRASTELGPLRPTFVSKIGQAQAELAGASASCAAGGRTTARRALERLARRMLIVRSRTRTLRARKTIPPALAARIGDDARDIAAESRAMQGGLECP